jgi:hypothetical protein
VIDSQEAILRETTIADAKGQATPEEMAFLRSDENVLAWHTQLQELCAETNALIAGIQAEYTPLFRDARLSQDWRTYKQLEVEQRERLIPARGQQKRFARAFQEASTLAKGRRAELKFEKQERHREQQKEAREKHNRGAQVYGRLLSDIREHLLEIEEYFSEAGEPMRKRFLARIESTFAEQKNDQ